MTNVFDAFSGASTSLYGELPNPAEDAGFDGERPKRVGFFTDTSVCIGCKACEVACKEWNLVPDDGSDASDLYRLTGMSYDNTGDLGASTWRHVAFIEDVRPHSGASAATGDRASTATGVEVTTGHLPSALPAVSGGPVPGAPRDAATAPPDGGTVDLLALLPDDGASGATGNGAQGAHGQQTPDDERDVRWLMSSDVCKHCTHAGCLDNCPTGALFRTEFGTVVVQDDICNGCGYCVPSCPYGVIDVRESDGGAHKCTLCYDRLGSGLEPACAKACPTNSIQFGDLDELQATADARLAELHGRGVEEARLYGRDPDDGVGGDGAFFLLLDEPEVYGLPPDPIVTTRDLPEMWRNAALTALGLGVAAVASFWRARK
ncbi:4Fe-4S dicluster domain-containing protein [Actinomycetospora endophytica]|uniref:4Fe-4S dicluster domain-containing protein n=1 Tax=Actinomycetospora endophytica TaxID=2291215 RepID=A0ABS8PIX1_9PSEU|nr:4Fe-4S dicluster domain-containing protein [Actinomycetospora endophytica]MCD2198226.1 4Fe-4S dicluster domain-containing protein [Actinomycetospora endophytica]